MQMPEDDRMQRLEKALKILSRVYDNNKVAGIYIRGLILCDEPRISGRSIPHLASLLESPEKIKLHVTPMVGLTIKAINLCAKNLNDIAFNYLDLDATLSGNIYYYNDIVGEISLLRNSMYSLNNSLIRRALAFDEMAKTAISLDASGIVRGGVPNQFRKPDPKSPTKWSLRGYSKFPDGTPVEAPKNTGANYKKVGSNPNMGRPKAAGSRNSNVPTNGLSVSFIDSDGTETPLEFDFLNSTWPQAKSYIEQEVMATLPDALEPGTKIGIDVYQKIEAAKEAELDGQLTPELSKITLFYDTVSKQLKAK